MTSAAGWFASQLGYGTPQQHIQRPTPAQERALDESEAAFDEVAEARTDAAAVATTQSRTDAAATAVLDRAATPPPAKVNPQMIESVIIDVDGKQGPPPTYASTEEVVPEGTPVHEMIGLGVIFLATVQTVLDCQLGLMMAAPWLVGKIALDCALVYYYGPNDELPNDTKMVNSVFAIPIMLQLISFNLINPIIRTGVKKITSTVLSGEEAGNLAGKLADWARSFYHAKWPIDGATEDTEAPTLLGRMTNWSMRDIIRLISSIAFGMGIVAVGAQFGLVAAIAVHATHNLAIFMINEAATRSGHRNYAVLRDL
ncbi:MAG: hypothetical protein P0S94_05370 [Simkaniaceae bacterium]|nr:hypothetical protein [Simkaniaceae bacterium]